jgi:hypothetical protein
VRANSKSSSALNEINDQDDDSNYEQEMDQAAANVADETKKPENDQDDNYSPEHGIPFGWIKLRRRLSKRSSTRQAFFKSIESEHSAPLRKIRGPIRTVPLSISLHTSEREKIVLIACIVALSIYLIGGSQWIDNHLPRSWIDSSRLKFFVTIAKKVLVFVVGTDCFHRCNLWLGHCWLQ